MSPRKHFRCSVIIPWCNRPELKRTLAKNLPLCATNGCEIIVVNAGGSPEGLLALIERLPAASLRCLDIKGASFNKCLAQNLGVAVSRHDHIFLLDADIVLEEEVFRHAARVLATPSVAVIDHVVESADQRRREASALARLEHSLHLELRDGAKITVEMLRRNFKDGSRSGPGLVLLRRTDFIAVGGMNSDLKGWGWEDIDLLVRLAKVRTLPRRFFGRVTHLSHGDEVRALWNESRNAGTCLTNYGAGHFLGTYQDDIARWRPRLRQIFGPPETG